MADTSLRWGICSTGLVQYFLLPQGQILLAALLTAVLECVSKLLNLCNWTSVGGKVQEAFLSHIDRWSRDLQSLLALIPLRAQFILMLHCSHNWAISNDLLLNASLCREQSAIRPRSCKHLDTSLKLTATLSRALPTNGDSVPLRARSYLQDALPDAQIRRRLVEM